jgi:prepilin-type N-terminal cleavage/methylation domain-containing protein
MCNQRKGFTLVELMMVISIIVLVSGMTIPLLAQFMDAQKLPRAAKIVATAIRNAQIVSLNYMMETQLEVKPGTDDKLRVWGYSGQCKYPTDASAFGNNWDGTNYLLVSEAKRIKTSGGTIRLLPLNQFSLEPQNSETYNALSAVAPATKWEFSELRYTHYTLKDSYNTNSTGYEQVPAFEGLKHIHSGSARGTTIGLDRPVGIQVQMSGQELPTGIGIDTVNYVVYYDDNGDGMPDGNPLALYIDKADADNHNMPMPLAQGNSMPNTTLYDDFAKRKPAKISGSVYFTREGTLRESLSLCYYSASPINISGGDYFESGTNEPMTAMIYGFIVYDRSDTEKRMCVQVSGMGQVRAPFGVHPPAGKKWGEGFNNQSATGQ